MSTTRQRSSRRPHARKIPLTSSRPAPRAIGYIRVSTEEQGRSGLGLEAQEASIRETCAANRWTLAELYRDIESGGKDEREGLKQALRALQSGDLLVIKEQSRMGRRYASLALLEELEDRGVRVFVSGPQRFAAVDLQTGVEGILAVEERRKIRERTQAALKAKKVRGEWVGRVPFGFRISAGGRLEEDANVLVLRRRAQRLRREGWSVRAIAGLLGVPKSTIHDALRVSLRALKSAYAA